MNKQPNLDTILNKVQAYYPEADVKLITDAYSFSERVHQGQRRRSGEPYFTHPAGVAEIITDMRLDVPSVVTSLLHDTVEDTLTTLNQIQERFGPEVATLVDGVTKISRMDFSSREERQAENFRKMIFAMARDIRVILVKLADRAHNMRTLSYLSEAKQREISSETLEIYAPLSHRLGIYWMKSELEDNSLRYLHPEVYSGLKSNVSRKKSERKQYIAEVIRLLQQKLHNAKIESAVSGRPKHFYSIYRKMQSQNLVFSQIYDLVGFRIVLSSVRECYQALGIIHSHWRPVPGRFKDYIALPKANMYQSLHTTVIGPYGERIEIQIRTTEMHRVAEEGIAAHWSYKDGRGREDARHFAWLRQLVELQKQVKDPQEFLNTVKEDLFADEVYAFTPQGDLNRFPKGSSIIDFAYRVHSELGDHCTGGKVNGHSVPLRHLIQNGDVIEIVTVKTQSPSKDWLKFVRTPKAKSRVRHWLKEEQRDRSIALGKELLEKDLARNHQSLASIRQKEDTFQTALRALGYHNEETLFAAVGYGRVTPAQIINQLASPDDSVVKDRQTNHPDMVGRKKEPAGVTVGGSVNVLIRFGRCCNPLPGEKIVGVITRGRGVTVHNAACQRLLESDPERHVAVTWDPTTQYSRPVKIEVLSEDRPGLLTNMSKAISSVGLNIAAANVRTLSDQRALNVFEVLIPSSADLQRVMRNLEGINGVVRVNRVKKS